VANDLPADIAQILEFLALMASGYDNHLKWNEEAKLKADLMHNRGSWDGFPADAVFAKCIELGMRDGDAGLITDLVRRAQAGARLVPQRSYKDFRFSHRA
jgi:hypothetical protein